MPNAIRAALLTAQKITVLFILAAIIPSAASFAQGTIQGTVLSDADGQPVVGVSIHQLGANNGTLTDGEGRFSLAVSQFPVTIRFTSLGYEQQQRVVTDAKEDIQVTLKTDAGFLEEVVITGYTTQQRKNIAGAITTVTFSEAQAAQADQDPIKLLQGTAAGVQVTSTSGSPGGGVSFIIRGNNSIGGSVEPLYVVDGIFLNTNLPVGSLGGNLQSSPLADINPADIESITLLKDANATAIYGSQGSNGVVVITTKRGKRNSGSRFNVSAKQGVSNAINKFEVTTGPETGQLLYEAWANTAEENGESLAEYLQRERPANWNVVFPFVQADGTPDFSRNNIANLPTYDRISDLFQTAGTADYQLSLAGGSANSNHYLALGYANQESVVKPNEFSRFSGRANYDNNVTERLKVGTSYSVARTERSKVYSNDNNPGGVINSAIFPRSFLPVYDEQGNLLNHATFNNHLRLIEHVDNSYVTWRNTVNLYGEYTILPELKFRTSGSFDYTNNSSRSFSDFALTNNGAASASNTNIQVYTAEQTLTYSKNLRDKHLVNALLGNTVYAQQLQGVNASGSDYIFDVLREVSSGGTTSGGSSRSENRLVSFFGTAGYTFDDKYNIEFNFRADGSSRFGRNVRWGYFPAGGISWNAGREDFVQNLGIFDALRVRASFGFSGNQNGIGNYDALAVWSTNAQAYLDQPALSPGRLGNPDLTWETTQQTNVGLDFSLLDNRLHTTIEAYHKYTTNGLQQVTVPSRSGYSAALRNYAEISNKGLEFTLQSINIHNDQFRWTTDFNISTNQNRIERIPQEQTMGATNRGTSILREGYPVNSFFLYKQLYVDPQTGNAVYEDVDGDGIITYADRQIVGSVQPDFVGGITNAVSYKDFDLNVFFYFTQGNDVLNMHNFFLVHGGVQNGIGFDPRQLERWQKPGDVTDIPKPTRFTGNPEQNNAPANNYSGQVAGLSSRYLDDASFLRLRNVALSYTVPTSFANKLGINRLKATISGTNLWTLTSYGGLDPEVSAQSSNQNTAGYDWATVPQPRTFEFILNLTL